MKKRLVILFKIGLKPPKGICIKAILWFDIANTGKNVFEAYQMHPIKGPFKPAVIHVDLGKSSHFTNGIIGKVPKIVD